ncbi:MAG: cupin domain-containing protein [Corynebacterium glutamicum]|nr:cupin domain-containing protein [Corynebacterium glutamicum]
MKKPQVFRPEALPAIDRGNGARTIPLVTVDRGATTFLNGITEFGPGAQIGHHIHNVVESVMVIKGNAIVDIDGERTELRTFDTTLVPANIPHHFENNSDTEEMVIFWTYASIDATRTLLASDTYGRIDEEHPGEQKDKPVTVVVEFESKEGIDSLAPILQALPGARGMRLDRSPVGFELVLSWDGDAVQELEQIPLVPSRIMEEVATYF